MTVIHCIFAGIVCLYLIWWASFAVVASMDLAKCFVRGLRMLRSQRFSVGKLLTWTAILAIWMAETRWVPALMILGCLMMAVVVVIRAGMAGPTVKDRRVDAPRCTATMKAMRRPE